MEKTFTYKSLEFKPIRQFTKEEEKRSWKGELLNFKKWFSSDEYNYSEFYEKANEVGAEKIDIFEIQTGVLKGAFAVPCSNYLALITDKKIIGDDNFYRVEVAEKCTELYKELFNSESSLFGEYSKLQIYWDNKYEYEYEILVNFEDKTIIFNIDDRIIDIVKFNDFFSIKEYLKNKDIKYFQEKFSDKNLTNDVALKIIDSHINLEDLKDNEQYIYIYFLYKYILYNIYRDKDKVNYKMNDLFDNEFVTIEENKTTEEILIEIRNDILEQLKKDMNIWLFDDMYYDE